MSNTIFINRILYIYIFYKFINLFDDINKYVGEINFVDYFKEDFIQ